ncbi:ORF6C domain-containing protein [Lacrimispora sp.]|uniref:ORF6C domain-containing protein n=1 Tax=Lacrimispora sp. TaxID=2719234 RepID=UPI00289D5274|nr:ORF6C domain-containing protein [Lacrimispora sp.]
MNDLKIFNNAEFGQIRTVDLEGKIYFVGNDIAKALEYARPYEAVTAHCKGAVSYRILTNGGEQEAKVIPEGDIYRLIVKAADQSRNPDIKEKAERFEVWVFDEVLPSLRQTGHYEMPNMSRELQAIIMIDRKQVQMEKRMDKLEYDIPLYGAEADELSGHVKRKGVNVLGGKQSEAYKDSEIRSKVYRDIYDQIRREFNLYDNSGKARSYKALKRKYIADAHELIDCYVVPTYLAELIEAANAQMNLGVA